jgi:hypothetical protein|tara:strand:- start:381 stop:839 length:459 start_codon:yes stop_codon:yes gene_type:complete
MANLDNKCSDLNIENKKSDSLDHIFEIQKKSQENNYNFNFEDLSLKEIADIWFSNKHALDDEICEMFDALGGVKDGIGNAAWKYWKKDHSKAKEMTIKDLSKEDLLELKFEIVDAFHFLINFGVSIGMTGSEFYNLFVSKNKENTDRQKRGY